MIVRKHSKFIIFTSLIFLLALAQNTFSQTDIPTSFGGIRLKMDESGRELWEFHSTSGANCYVHLTDEDGIRWGITSNDDDAFGQGTEGSIITQDGSLRSGVPTCFGDRDACEVRDIPYGNVRSRCGAGTCSLSFSLVYYKPMGDILCSGGMWRLCDSTFHDKVYTTTDKDYKCTTANAWHVEPRNITVIETCPNPPEHGNPACCPNPNDPNNPLCCPNPPNSSIPACRTPPPTICAYPGPHNPGFTVSDPPVNLQQKVGRVMMCYPPVEASMDHVVELANSAYSAGISRVCCMPEGGWRKDTINLPTGQVADIIVGEGGPNPRWGWQIVVACTCRPWSTGGTCGGTSSLGTTCTITEKLQTRSCNPTRCEPESRCVEDLGCAPLITSVAPMTLKKGQELTINGLRLAATVRYIDPAGNTGTFTGTVNEALTQTKLPLPTNIPTGTYRIRIYRNDRFISNEVTIAVTSSLLKYTPDGSATGYCPLDSQCLLNAGTGECADDTAYSGDNYCENGEWSTRTKVAAVKLLNIKSGDYTLFCSRSREALNDQDYVVSGRLASDIVNSLGANNFCILKYNSQFIGATALNNPLASVAQYSSLLQIANCDGATAEDGNYYSCDSSNKVWYNPKLKIVIFSSSPISGASSPSNPANFIAILANPIRALAQAISTIISPPPFDDVNAGKIKKFEKLYMMQEGGKTVKGILEGGGMSNLLIEYNNFNNDLCTYIASFESSRDDTSSGIECRRQGNIHYVLAQGNSFSNIDPDRIWTDLTSNLRIR